jgi:hypothetical protein
LADRRQTTFSRRSDTNCLMKQHDLFCLYGSKSIPDISLDKWYEYVGEGRVYVMTSSPKHVATSSRVHEKGVLIGRTGAEV